MKLIAITGGIGSGKSVASRIVNVMGFGVYDCDSRARTLMVESGQVRAQLVQAFGSEIYLADGSLNRQQLSARAFGNEQALSRLNAIVHPATASDMLDWAAEQATRGAKAAFVETALLRTASLDRLVDQVWHVTAPPSVRIDRVMARSGLTARQVEDRMAAQAVEDTVAPGEHEIVNDNHDALLPRVIHLINHL